MILDINCPYCQGYKVVKNCHGQGKQSDLSCECSRQFRGNPCPIDLSYDQDLRKSTLKTP